jgi:hypothetical protein
MNIGLIAMSGIRALDPQLLELGLTLGARGGGAVAAGLPLLAL